MFSLPLSRNLDIALRKDEDGKVLHFKTWDGRASLGLTIEEAKNLVELLCQPNEAIVQYLDNTEHH